MDESTPNRSVSGHAANLFDVLSAAAETFLANHPAVVAARTATGAHAPTVLPAATGPRARTWDQLAPRTGAASALPHPPPQVSCLILPGAPPFGSSSPAVAPSAGIRWTCPMSSSVRNTATHESPRVRRPRPGAEDCCHWRSLSSRSFPIPGKAVLTAAPVLHGVRGRALFVRVCPWRHLWAGVPPQASPGARWANVGADARRLAHHQRSHCRPR